MVKDHDPGKIYVTIISSHALQIVFLLRDSFKYQYMYADIREFCFIPAELVLTDMVSLGNTV